VCPQVPGEGQSGRGGYPSMARALWVRCPVDEQMHLLGARAVLELVALGCALAWCGALLTSQDLIPRAVGAPCLRCLVVGSAS
jgi:hypothetical protein